MQRSRHSVNAKDPFDASSVPISDAEMRPFAETTPFAETLRYLDDLMAEARLLRARITAALRREEAPFFPERRHRHEAHEPDRRRTR